MLIARVLAGAACLLYLGPGGAFAAEQWLLMARHGECTEIDERARRRIPELAEAPEPHAFVKLMRQKGHAATADEMPLSRGRAVEVRVPERNLAMVFATRDLCRELARK